MVKALAFEIRRLGMGAVDSDTTWLSPNARTMKTSQVGSIKTWIFMFLKNKKLQNL